MSEPMKRPAAEEWRPVVGWEGRYEVSSLGRIRKCDGQLVGQYCTDQGYTRARLSDPRAEIKVHRIVAIAFLENPQGKPSINHIDCDRANNAVENLEWCTQAENIRHSAALGRMRRETWLGRHRSPTARLSDQQVIDLRHRYSTGAPSYGDLAREFKLSKRSVGRIISREHYQDVC